MKKSIKINMTKLSIDELKFKFERCYSEKEVSVIIDTLENECGNYPSWWFEEFINNGFIENIIDKIKHDNEIIDVEYEALGMGKFKIQRPRWSL